MQKTTNIYASVSIYLSRSSLNISTRLFTNSMPYENVLVFIFLMYKLTILLPPPAD